MYQSLAKSCQTRSSGHMKEDKVASDELGVWKKVPRKWPRTVQVLGDGSVLVVDGVV